MREPKGTPVATRKTVTYSQNSVLGVLAALVLLLLSFYVGTLYQKSHNPPSMGVRREMGGRLGRLGGLRAGNAGTVSSVSSSSITIVTFLNGASKTFSIDNNTQVTNNGQKAAASDIKTGDRVLVRTGTSGSTAATAIDINPDLGGRMMEQGATTSST